MQKSLARFFYVLSILSILFLQIGIIPVAAAATFAVNSNADAVDANPGDGVCQTTTPGQCTLRAAVQEANALPGADTITVPAGTYTLSIAGAGENAAATGDLDVTQDVSITGAGMGVTIVDANNLDRAFHVVSGTLQLSDLTVQHGLANPGGGVLVNSQATITRVSFNNNQSTSTAADGTGGGVFVDLGASATITLSQFANNFAYFGGGAVSSANTSSTLSISDSTFDTNSSVFGGGAVYPNGSSASIANSTFINNHADVGGAIHSNAASVQVVNSTFVGNTGTNDAAIDSRVGTITVNNSSFSGNTASGTGDTVGAQIAQGGHLHLLNSILTGSDTNTCGASITDDGNNLSWPAGNNCPGTITQADPLLGPLASNGGNTQTMALGAGSPAIDAGNNGTCAATDQRGVARPVGPACDIGAFERTVNIFTVANTDDGGAGSLRQAILDANATANTAFGPDEIHFNIPVGGVQTIHPASALPTITAPVIVDGYTQPGASANSLAIGGNAVLLIQLSGTSVPGTAALNLGSGSDGSTVRGLVINGGFGIGVLVNGGAYGTIIQGNYIGTNASGTAASPTPNGTFGLYSAGVLVDTSSNTQIGGTTPAKRNVIAGNHADGIALWNPGITGTVIQGNYVGVGSDGVTALGNGGSGGSFGAEGGGITLRNFIANTLIGGSTAGAGNIIANNGPYGIVDYSGTQTTIQGNTISGQTKLGIFLGGSQHLVENNTITSNAGDGIRLTSSQDTVQNNVISSNTGAGVTVTGGSANDIQNNSIHDNTGVGIDLGGDGASFDHLYALAGPNDYQNYPILNLATSDGNTLRLVGTLTSQPNQAYVLDIYSSPTCDATSFGEGQTYLGSFPVATDSSGNSSFDQTLAVGAIEPHVITATATGPSGTSEFSYCRPVATPNLNWVQALAVSSGSSTQQYFTDRFQEKWFKFPVQPGDTVQVTLTGQPGSAISLHSDPNLIYNELINPQSAAALSAEAADSAFLPSGSLPSGSLPSGSLPSGSLPSGSLPSGSLETGYLPSGSLPSGSLPSGSLPSGSLPSGSLPSGSLPSGSLPSGSLPSGSLPSGSLPSGSLPSGSLPSGSLPSGSLPSGSLPSGSLPSGSLPSGSLPSGSLPSGSLDAYASAARRSLLGISMDPYATVQTIERSTYDTSGDLYIRVVGPFSLTAPFKVDVAVLGGTCSGIQSVPNNLAVINGSPQGPGLQTLILTDSGRLYGTSTQIATALSDLQSFSTRADVNGAVIDLHSAQYPRVGWANAQADQYPTCPAAKNMVAAEIKAVIDAYRAANGSSVQYIVLAGGAAVIPFYQTPDVAGLANEKEYVAPVAANTPSEAGFKTGLVEGQDYYGSQGNFTQGGLTIAMPNLAVGRLVDSAPDISAAVQTYVATNGVITPHSSLVTGYDFVGDAAEAIKLEMNAGTNSQADTLIEDQGLPPSDPSAWTAADLQTKLLAGNHDIVVLTGHFSAGNLLAADYSTGLSASGIAASAAPLNNVLVLALGCHSGYSIPNNDLLLNASPNPDWAKAFLAKGAAGYVAASGYAYGDTELTEYGERLFVEMSQQLRTGNGPISIGQALVAAKQQYIANTAQLTGIDQKTIAEMTLYGLPMMKVNMPGQRLNPVASTSIVSGTSPFASGPAANTTLSSTTVTLSPATSVHTLSLPNLANNSTVTTTYLSGADGVIANPFEPIYPKDIYDVSVAGKVLRGVAFYGGTYADQGGIVPLTSAPTTETSRAHLSFNTEVFYPTQIWMPNFSEALDGGRTRLVAIPAQFQSSAPGAIDGTLRSFDTMRMKFYYLPDNWPASGSASVKAAAVSAAPSILGASAVADGSNVDFSVNAEVDGSSGVQEVWVLYTGKPGSPYYGEWFPLDLTQTATDPTRWEGALALQGGADPQDILFMVEAVGGAGLTNLATNLGAYYTVTPENAGQLPPPAATTTTLQSSPSSGTYLKNSSFDLSLMAGAQPLGNQLVSLNIGGQQALVTTDSNGNASATLKLVVPPGSYSVEASFLGTSGYLGSTDTAPFTVSKDGTAVQVAGSPATIAQGDPTPIVATVVDSAGHPLGGKSVFFIVHNGSNTFVRSVIADYQGKAPLGTVSLPNGVYAVDAYFNGTIPLSPTPLNLSDDYYESSSHLGSSLTIAAPPDHTPPTITASATKADNTPYTAGTWTNQTVTVHFTCSDSDSGIASCPADQIFSTDGTFTASGTATDNANNSANASFGPIKVDKTKPTLSPVVNPNPVLLNGTATVTSGAADTLSGLASQSCGALVTNSVGSKSVTCTATDNAGNTMSTSVTYKVIYRFDGFMQPINDTGHSQICIAPCPVSIFKGGSTVPTKFQLKDANGNIVQSTALPLWVTPQKGSATSSSVDESLYTDPATVGTAYSWSGNQYVYNWSTKGFASGFYWRIGVQLDDGQIYYVTIGLR
jgi:CSLREA domain-containing protein